MALQLENRETVRQMGKDIANQISMYITRTLKL